MKLRVLRSILFLGGKPSEQKLQMGKITKIRTLNWSLLLQCLILVTYVEKTLCFVLISYYNLLCCLFQDKHDGALEIVETIRYCIFDNREIILKITLVVSFNFSNQWDWGMMKLATIFLCKIRNSKENYNLLR